MADSPRHADPARSVPAGLAGAAGLAATSWRAFGSWRRSRPFWAGALLLLAGAELLLLPLPMHSMGLILHIGVGGVLGILIGAILMAAGLLLWFNPAQRLFYSIVAVLLAITALIASNLGGFLLGTLLGVVGGSLGFAWAPLPPGTEVRRRWWRTVREPGRAVLTTPGAPTDRTGPGEAAVVTQPGTATSAEGATDSAGISPETGHSRGTVIRGFTLLPILAILAGLLHLGSSSQSQAADPSSASPAASCVTVPSVPLPLPLPTPSPTCNSPATAPTPDPIPAQGAISSSRPGASQSSSVSTSPSPSPSATPGSGTPPPFAIATSRSTLTAASAELTGFAYDGVVSVPTSRGPVQMMQFSASSLDLSGVHQTVTQGGGTLTTTASSLDLSGDVVLYATELSGDLILAGVPVPVTIMPSSPVSVVLQFLGDIGASQALTLQMTNVTTQQPYTSATGMSASALQIT